MTVGSRRCRTDASRAVPRRSWQAQSCPQGRAAVVRDPGGEHPEHPILKKKHILKSITDEKLYLD
eukprot:5075783-Heterocapsa_arctica.AAC.1